jgi:hypothetical protein
MVAGAESGQCETDRLIKVAGFHFNDVFDAVKVTK